MKKSSVQKLLFILLLIGGSWKIQAQHNVAFDWVKHYGDASTGRYGVFFGIGGGTPGGNHVVVDDWGNVYTIAMVTNPGGRVDFGSFTFNSDSAYFVLMKSDDRGNVLWARQIHLPDGNMMSITIDKSAGKDCSGQQPDIVIAGMFNGIIRFNDSVSLSTPGQTSSDRNGFIAKYNSDGNFLWVKEIDGATSSANVLSISTDRNGNIYAMGSYTGIVSLTGTSLTVAGNRSSAYLLKLNKYGNSGWMKTLEVLSGSPSRIDGQQITVSEANDIYVTGSFRGDVDFDMSSSIADTFVLRSHAGSSTGGDIFAARYDTSGKLAWAVGMGGKGQNDAFSITADIDGNAYISGYINDTAFFGRDTFISTPTTIYFFGFPIPSFKRDIFITRINSSGNLGWTKQLKSVEGRSSSWAHIGAIITTHPTHTTGVYIGGMFSQDSTDFDPGPGSYYLSPGLGGYNGFILRLDEAGNFGWVKTLEGEGKSDMWGMTIDKSGKIYAVGAIREGPVDFDLDTSVTNRTLPNGNADGYILKLISTDTNSASINVTLDCDEGSHYILECDTFTESGTYTHKFTNHLGADSTLTANVTFKILDVNLNIDINVLRTLETYTTYQWYKDSVLIPGATERNYTVLENGKYYVVVTNERGCDGTSEEYVVNNVSVTNVASEKSVGIYPNPAKDKLYINSPVDVNLTLTTIEGRVITQKNNTLSFSIGHLAQGIYLLRVSDPEGRVIKVEKIVKQ